MKLITKQRLTKPAARLAIPVLMAGAALAPLSGYILGTYLISYQDTGGVPPYLAMCDLGLDGENLVFPSHTPECGEGTQIMYNDRYCGGGILDNWLTDYWCS